MTEKPRRKAQPANGQRPQTTRVRSKKAHEPKGAVEPGASAPFEPEIVALQVADPEAEVQPAGPEILVAQAAEPEVVAAEPVAAISVWAFSGQLAWSQLVRSGAQALLLYGALAQNALEWQCAALRGLANSRR
jgi:hypothetical protein